jgi:hypothetical protein
VRVSAADPGETQTYVALAAMPELSLSRESGLDTRKTTLQCSSVRVIENHLRRNSSGELGDAGAHRSCAEDPNDVRNGHGFDSALTAR